MQLISLKIRAIKFSKKKYFTRASRLIIVTRGLLALGSLGLFIFLLGKKTEDGEIAFLSPEFRVYIGFGHDFNNAVRLISLITFLG